MAERPTFRDFAVTVLRRSMANWHGSEGWFALATYFTVLILPLLATGVVEDILGEAFSKFLALGATGWLVVLFFVVTPYRMWRDEYSKAEEYKERMRSKIRATYDDNSPACRKKVLFSADQGKTGIEGYSIRVKVESDSDVPIKACVGYLTKIEFRINGNGFREIDIYEPYRMSWATEPDEFAPVDIFPGVPKFLGIFSSTDGEELFRIKSQVISYVSPHQFKDVGVYMLTLQLIAKETGKSSLCICVEWNGKWDELKVWDVANT